MRTLGLDATVAEYKVDLVYLHASLLADENTEISSLANSVGTHLTELRAEREGFELAEDAAEVMSARTSRRDKTLDRVVITFGGVVRAVAPKLYEQFFSKLNPSGVARSPLADEVQSVETILGQLAALPSNDPVRATYEAPMRAALTALKSAMSSKATTDTALAIAESRVAQFKLKADRERHVVFGKLVAILGDKKLADEYFRPKRRAAKEDDEDPAPPAPPAPPVS